MASWHLLGAAVEILQLVQYFLLEFVLVVLELGPLLNDLLEEDVVPVLEQHLLCEFLILRQDGCALLIALLLQVLLYYFPVLLPQAFFSVVCFGLVGCVILYELLFLLGVAVLEPVGDFDGVELLEGEFDFAGRGVVLACSAVVVGVDVVEVGEVLVGVGVVAVLQRLLLLFVLCHHHIRLYNSTTRGSPLFICNQYPFMADNQRIEPHIHAKFKVANKVGSGAYGHVWKVVPNDRPGEVLALKKVFEAFQHATDAQRTFREVSTLRKVEHPNIIKLYQVIPSTSERDIYLTFEFMSTDLHHLIYEQQLKEVHRKFVIYQLLLGLHYLHSARLMHRDLKPSNLLLSQQCHLKICDFGLVRHLGSTHQEESSVMTEGVATKWYRAPQILFGSHSYGQKVDLWSVGCILGEMLTKCPLFNSNSTIGQIEKIIQLTGRPTSQQVLQMGVESAQSIIKQCGSVKHRNPRQIFGVNADEQSVDLLMNLLRFSASKRFTALEALRHPYLKDFYKESDIRQYKGEVKLEADDNVKLSTAAYRQLIIKHFVEKKQPLRFSDLRREKSFGKVLGELNTRKASGEKQERRNVHLFEEILREKENSLKGTRHNSNQRDKENVMVNMGQKESNLDKFAGKGAKTGTFAALRKVGASRLCK